MIYELRIYRAVPGRLPAVMKRFETITLDLWKRHGIRQAGFWTTLIGESNQELTYMLAWDSLAEREHGFRSDLPVGEDYDFFLRVLRHCEAGVVAEKLLLRTVRPDSLSRQDFALDARVDLETLRRFVRENPDFAAAHARRISGRLAAYHGDFAYSLIAQGRRRAALAQSLASLRESPNLPALKTLLRSLLPR